MNKKIPEINIDDMPSFLNEVAHEYFKDNDEIRLKLIQCSAYIHGFNSVMKMKENNRR